MGKKGFTLIELLIVIVMGVVFIASILTLFGKDWKIDNYEIQDEIVSRDYDNNQFVILTKTHGAFYIPSILAGRILIGETRYNIEIDRNFFKWLSIFDVILDVPIFDRVVNIK